MFFLARKNLFEQPLRLAFAILGVALAVMLIVVMWAIVRGVLSQVGAFVKNTDAQVWVVQDGFTDIAHGFSVVPASLEPKLERVPGVETARPIVVARTEVPTDAGDQTLGVIGYDTKSGIGGPWEYASRPAVPKPGELVVDETFADTAGLEVGDTIAMSDRKRRIVGLSADTNQFSNQLAFGHLSDVRGLMRLRDDVNFFALQVRPGQADRVERQIESRFTGVTAFSKATFLANNEREVREGFQPILYLMVGIAFFVGTATVGLTVYTATTEKAREYGVLSAMGADHRQLSGVIVRQAAMMSAAGFVLGTALVVPAAALMTELAPKTEFEYPPWVFAISAAAAVLISLVASYVPVRRIASVDPATVFRA